MSLKGPSAGLGESSLPVDFTTKRSMSSIPGHSGSYKPESRKTHPNSDAYLPFLPRSYHNPATTAAKIL